jgi:hypothetical protein
MKIKNVLGILAAAASTIVVLCMGLWAAGPDTGSSPVQITVTVSSRGRQFAAQLSRRDVTVFENKQRRPVLDLTPVGSSARGTDLAILVDGSLRSNIALQFNDLRNFIDSLPPSTSVGIAYSQYGTERFVQGFTTNRQATEAGLRLPEGPINVGGSIYQSVSSLAKHWPADGRARSVLLISDGLDIWRGLSETNPVLNPDLDEAIAESQKAGVTVYAIYANGATDLTRNLILLNNGQSMLARLASETGGEAYFQGDETPVAFRPFLTEMRATLEQQYILTFEAIPGTEEGRLRITTELPHVHIDAPASVWHNEGK